MDDTVDSSVSVETTKLMGRGQDGIFTQCVCTEYEYAETPKHTHTLTHKHTHTTLCLLTHKILGSTVKHLFDEATLEILDSYPYLPAKPEVVGLYWWCSVTFVYFILFARVN